MEGSGRSFVAVVSRFRHQRDTLHLLLKLRHRRRCREAFTAELRVRFRGRVCPREELHVRGRVLDKRKRHIQAEATLLTNAGEERAHAWGVFLEPAVNKGSHEMTTVQSL